MTRGRRPNIERSSRLELNLAESTRVRLDLILFSPLEQRVPHGAYSRFFEARLADFFDGESIDLAPYAISLPGELTVRGTPAAIAALKATLES